MPGVLAKKVDNKSEDGVNFEFFEQGNDIGLGVVIDFNAFTEKEVEETTKLLEDASKLEDKSSLDDTSNPENNKLPELPKTPTSKSKDTVKRGIPNKKNKPVNSKEINLGIDDYARRLEELASSLPSIDTGVILSDTPPITAKGLEVVDEVEANNLQLDNITELEDAYTDQTAIVKEKVIEVVKDKKTFLDRVGLAIKWLANTFIVAPIRGVFKATQKGVTGLFGFVGDIILKILMTIILTVVGIIFYTNFVDTSLSTADVVKHNLGIILDVLALLGDGFLSLVVELLGKL